MADMLSATEFAALHGKNRSTILRAVADGKIEGAIRIGNQWCIPKDAKLPPDGRVKSGKYRNWRKPKAED